MRQEEPPPSFSGHHHHLQPHPPALLRRRDHRHAAVGPRRRLRRGQGPGLQRRRAAERVSGHSAPRPRLPQRAGSATGQPLCTAGLSTRRDGLPKRRLAAAAAPRLTRPQRPPLRGAGRGTTPMRLSSSGSTSRAAPAWWPPWRPPKRGGSSVRRRPRRRPSVPTVGMPKRRTLSTF